MVSRLGSQISLANINFIHARQSPNQMPTTDLSHAKSEKVRLSIQYRLKAIEQAHLSARLEPQADLPHTLSPSTN